MSDTAELIYIGSLGFITILIIDFIAIELVLKLGVFAFGKPILRIYMILGLYINYIMIFLFEIGGASNYNYLAASAVIYATWNPLYYYMLMEQNFYLMTNRVKKALWVIFIIAIVTTVLVSALFLFISLGIIGPIIIEYAYIGDLLLLVILSSVEFFLIIKIYTFSKSKVRRVSLKLWKKVEFSIIICSFCVLIDIIIIILENTGVSGYAYVFKICTFCFKIVFECLFFQFIKGIVVSVDMAQ